MSKPASHQGDLRRLPEPLAPLISRPNWVLWRWERTAAGNGEEKWTKVPYQPNRRKASTTDDATWSTYDLVIRALDGGGFDGIGFCINGDIAAFDVDDCRDPGTGSIKPWARQLVADAKSYTEVTVSGTGLRIIGLGDGEHVHKKQPAPDGMTLETYRKPKGRYIVITGNPLSDPPSKIVNIDATVDAVVSELDANKPRGPGNQPGEGGGSGERRLPRDLLNMLYLTGKHPAGYVSRSELRHAFICEALRRGIDESEIVQAATDPAFAGCSIYDHCAKNGGRDYVKRQIERAANEALSTSEGKRIIRVRSGETFRVWREVQRAIVARKDNYIYVRGGSLVEALWRWERDDADRDVLVCELVPYSRLRLSDVIARHACEFVRSDGRGKWRRVEPPKDVIETLLTRGDWDFPTVVGLINTPTMRRDGSLLLAPGYDPSTRLWYKPAADVKLPPIPDRPTKEQAREALDKLDGLLGGFPFADEVSRSVALAGMLTPILRGAIAVVPIFAVIAPEPRTGKTFLIEMIGVLATGHKPVAIAGSRKQEEFEKRIETAALSGRAIMHLNNLPNGMVVESEGLSQMSTENQIIIRKLGRHEEGLCNCQGTVIYINGNNIVVAADLVPRTPICRLNANMENPGERKFEFNPIARVREDRAGYLAAAFTVARAYLAAGCPEQEGRRRVAGFEDWSRLVQQPLLWLGIADPLGGIESARATDPTLEELRRLISVLRRCFPLGSFTVGDCERLAEEQEADPVRIGGWRFKNRDLRDLMTFHGKINVVSFGHLLRRHRDRVIDGWCVRVSPGKDANTYRLVGTEEAVPRADTETSPGTDPDVI